MQQKTPLYLVDAQTGCWQWQRKITHGYAYITINHKAVRAARWFYTQRYGPIPDGLQIDHLCRNRACVNPDHLEAVTHTANIRRASGTKMTEEKAKQVREMAGSMTEVAIARKFGVHAVTIHHIIAGETWR